MRSWLSEAGRTKSQVEEWVAEGAWLGSQPGTLVYTSGVYVKARGGATAHMWAGHMGLEGRHSQGAGSQSQDDLQEREGHS